MKKIGVFISLWLLVILVACSDSQMFIIAFDVDGGDAIGAIEFSQTYLVEDIDKLNPTKAGHAFDGWYLNTDLSEASKLVDDIKSSVILYASWTVLEYQITFNLDGGTINAHQVLGFTIFDEVDLLEPEKLGYDFLGWVQTPSSKDTVHSIEKGTTGNQTFYALWKNENTNPDVTITFKNYDGTVLNEITVEAGYKAVYEGDNPAKPATSTHTFEFIGWDHALEVVYEDIVYTAVFKEVLISNETTFDIEAFNAVFNFDVYSLLPSIQTTDYEMIDASDDEYKEVYIDLFDWTLEDLMAYEDLLFDLFEYDELNYDYLVGDYFVYTYEDDTIISGVTVYGIGVYTYNEDNTPVVPVDPVSGLYYSFNIQNTTTSLPGSYKDSIDQVLQFAGNSFAVIKASHVADVGTAPAGLTSGMIFAANVSGNAQPLVYLEIDTQGHHITSISFSIQGDMNIRSKLKDARVQIYVGNQWQDLNGGNFFSQISSSVSTITIENINASKFRLLFEGNGETSNGARFKIGQVDLYHMEEVEPPYELWSDVVSSLEAKFDDLDFNTYMPEFEGLTSLSLLTISQTEYRVVAQTTENTTQLYAAYINLLLQKGFMKDDTYSMIRGQDVYVISRSDDLVYGMYITYNATQVEIVIFLFDPEIGDISLETLSKRQSINEFEVSRFGMSGLPSTGVYDVLVIPIEIKDNPFESNYLTKLDTVFNGTSSQTGWESVSSYYYKSSYGQLDLSFDIVPKYVTNYSRSHYESKDDEGDQFAILEALLALDPTIDFSKYDSNNDGVIDSIIFIYSVDYDYDVDLWWAWVYTAQNGEASSLDKLDNKYFEYYMWASYSFMDDDIPGYSNLILNSETYVHELGHLMGLEDYYPYEGDNEFGPLGGFDMMDYNVGDHGPFNKLILGWLEPLIAQKGHYQVTLDNFALDDDGRNNTLLIPYNVNDLNDGNAFDEYLLIMFYSPNGLYEAHSGLEMMPEHPGVIIYHVDARLSSNPAFWEGYFRNSNEGFNNFLVQILEADKNNSIPGNQSIVQSDLFTSGTLNLSNYNWNQGGAMNISLTMLSSFNKDSETVTFNIEIN